jgi:hypothetical protein
MVREKKKVKKRKNENKSNILMIFLSSHRRSCSAVAALAHSWLQKRVVVGLARVLGDYRTDGLVGADPFWQVPPRGLPFLLCCVFGK